MIYRLVKIDFRTKENGIIFLKEKKIYLYEFQKLKIHLFIYIYIFFIETVWSSKLFFRYDVASGDLHLEERTKGRKNLLVERWRGRKFRGGGQALLQELNWKGKRIPLDQTTLVNRWPVVGDWSNFFERTDKFSSLGE